VRETKLSSEVEYTANILAQVTGIEAFLADRSQSPKPRLISMLESAGQFTFPGTRKAIGDYNVGTVYFGTRMLAALSSDLVLGILLPIAMGQESENIALGVGTKLAYNLGIAVLPDALRSIRRKFSLIQK